MKAHVRVFLLCAAMHAASGAWAQTDSVPQGVLNLSATASLELTKDWLTITLSTTREGVQASAVQGEIKQALDAALVQARRVAKTGQVEVQTGDFSLHPRYAPKGGIAGWQGSANLVIEGRDMAALAQLAGAIQSLSIAGVSQSLSRQARETAELEVSGLAIARYRVKAAEATRQFGYSGYTLREVSVSANDGAPEPVPMLRQRAMAASDAALPVEAGKALVTATVSGSIQMK